VSLDRVVTAVTSAITGAVLSSFLLQEMNVKINRKKEIEISICFTWFPISYLVEIYLYQNLVCFTRIWDFTWRLSDSVKN